MPPFSGRTGLPWFATYLQHQNAWGGLPARPLLKLLYTFPNDKCRIIHPALFSSQSLIGTLGRMLPGKYTNPSIYNVLSFLWTFRPSLLWSFLTVLPPPNLNPTRAIPSALFFHPSKQSLLPRLSANRGCRRAAGDRWVGGLSSWRRRRRRRRQDWRKPRLFYLPRL